MCNKHTALVWRVCVFTSLNWVLVDGIRENPVQVIIIAIQRFSRGAFDFFLYKYCCLHLLRVYPDRPYTTLQRDGSSKDNLKEITHIEWMHSLMCFEEITFAGFFLYDGLKLRMIIVVVIIMKVTHINTEFTKHLHKISIPQMLTRWTTMIPNVIFVHSRTLSRRHQISSSTSISHRFAFNPFRGDIATLPLFVCGVKAKFGVEILSIFLNHQGCQF